MNVSIVPRNGICCNIPTAGPKKLNTLSKSPLRFSLNEVPIPATVKSPPS